MHHLLFVLLGAAAAPLVGPVARFTTRTLVKGGVVVGHTVREAVAEAKTEIDEVRREIEADAEKRAAQQTY